MDSRDYVYAFDIQGLNGAPADFELPSGISNPIAGVFLPQAAPDWLGRRKYPARILLATEEALWVIAHSTACVLPARILLRDLEALECARFLLLGWIGLHTGIGEHVLAYNQRSCDVVDRFLLGIKARWMPRELRFCRVPKQTFGAALDQKFNFAWSSEAIDEHEYPLIRYFQPTTVHRRRWFFYRRESWSAGDLLVLTERRVLWIAERYGTVYAPYGIVSRSAPLSSLRGFHPCMFNNQPSLECDLSSGRTWRFQLATGLESEARRFTDCVNGVLPLLKEPGRDLDRRTSDTGLENEHLQ